MTKTVAILLGLFLLVASWLIIAKPVFSSNTTAENFWTSKASMQVARDVLGVAAVNGKIYAIGGSAYAGILGVNEEYDPTTNSWTFKKPMPTPRMSFATAVFQNKIYCIGGKTNKGNYVGLNEVYDPATDTWETKAAMPTTRQMLSANVANGKIYLIGGASMGGLSNNTWEYAGSLNEAYDPLTDSWTTKASVPQPLSADYASAVVENKIYIFERYLNQIYDAETDTWSQGAAPPSLVISGEAGVTTGVNAPKRIYVLTEQYDSKGAHPPYQLYVYDFDLDSWTDGATMPTERTTLGVTVVDDMLYAIGGSKMVFNSTVPFNFDYYIVLFATNEQYTPFGYVTPEPSSSSSTSAVPQTQPDSPQTASINPESEPFSIELVAAASTASVVATVGLLLYFKKKQETKTKTNSKVEA